MESDNHIGERDRARQSAQARKQCLHAASEFCMQVRRGERKKEKEKKGRGQKKKERAQKRKVGEKKKRREKRQLNERETNSK